MIPCSVKMTLAARPSRPYRVPLYAFLGLGLLQATKVGAGLLVNPGAEAGSIAGWTGTGSVDKGVFNPAILPHSGIFAFLGRNNINDTLSQRVDLGAAGYTAGQLDSGTLYATVDFWVRSLNQGDPSDSEGVTLIFDDVASAAISTFTTGLTDSRFGWTARTATVPIPVGTRTIVYEMDFKRLVGTDNDAYIDDNVLTLGVPEPSSVAAIGGLLLAARRRRR